MASKPRGIRKRNAPAPVAREAPFASTWREMRAQIDAATEAPAALPVCLVPPDSPLAAALEASQRLRVRPVRNIDGASALLSHCGVAFLLLESPQRWVEAERHERDLNMLLARQDDMANAREATLRVAGHARALEVLVVADLDLAKFLVCACDGPNVAVVACSSRAEAVAHIEARADTSALLRPATQEQLGERLVQQTLNPLMTSAHVQSAIWQALGVTADPGKACVSDFLAGRYSADVCHAQFGWSRASAVNALDLLQRGVDRRGSAKEL